MRNETMTISEFSGWIAEEATKDTVHGRRIRLAREICGSDHDRFWTILMRCKVNDEAAADGLPQPWLNPYDGIFAYGHTTH